MQLQRQCSTTPLPLRLAHILWPRRRHQWGRHPGHLPSPLRRWHQGWKVLHAQPPTTMTTDTYSLWRRYAYIPRMGSWTSSIPQHQSVWAHRPLGLRLFSHRKRDSQTLFSHRKRENPVPPKIPLAKIPLAQPIILLSFSKNEQGESWI